MSNHRKRILNSNTCPHTLKRKRPTLDISLTPRRNPLNKLLQGENSTPNFNLHIIDYVHNTTLYTKLFLKSHNLQNLINPQQLNITQTNSAHIQHLHTRNDIILTKTDKNMGCALVPTLWFTNKYARHFTDTTTYRRIDNFDLTLRKLQLRFDKLLSTPTNKQLLDTVTKDKLQIPYMKLLPKVHKLTDTASPNNLDKLTGRSIITAHSGTTSNPSRLLGTELDKIILRLKDIFEERN